MQSVWNSMSAMCLPLVNNPTQKTLPVKISCIEVFLFYQLIWWEHQLFYYDWLFYKCFSVLLFRNVLTRSGYWLLITQLNCLYCTTDSLALTRPDFLTPEFFGFFWVFFVLLWKQENKNKKKWSRNVNCLIPAPDSFRWTRSL